MWTGLIWLRTESNDLFLEHGHEFIPIKFGIDIYSEICRTSLFEAEMYYPRHTKYCQSANISQNARTNVLNSVQCGLEERVLCEINEQES
jgi:hypothetical protein